MCVPDWRHTVGYKGQSQLHFSHDQASPRSRSLFSYLPKMGQIHTGHSAGLIHYMRTQHALWRVRLRIQNSGAKNEKNSEKSSRSDCHLSPGCTAEFPLDFFFLYHFCSLANTVHVFVKNVNIELGLRLECGICLFSIPFLIVHPTVKSVPTGKITRVIANQPHVSNYHPQNFHQCKNVSFILDQVKDR